jgi:hypothetical protein
LKAHSNLQITQIQAECILITSSTFNLFNRRNLRNLWITFSAVKYILVNELDFPINANLICFPAGTKILDLIYKMGLLKQLNVWTVE